MATTRDPLFRRLLWPVLGMQVLVAYGVAGYMILEGWSFVDALYMTFIAITTVGFEEARPLDTSGELFTISLVTLGVILLLVTVTLLAIWISEGNIGERRRRIRMQKQIDRMKDHFIVCAYGRVGRTVSREFAAEKAPFVVVEADPGLEERMIEEGVLHILGDPTEEEILEAAGVERARGLICAVDSDATNTLITVTARSMNPELFIVARASESRSISRLERAGADRVVSPYQTSGQHMALMATRPSIRGYLEMARDEARSLRVEEVAVEPGSPLEGQTVQDACGGATLLAIRHADGAVTPNPRRNSRVSPGDRLVLLGEEETLRTVEEA